MAGRRAGAAGLALVLALAMPVGAETIELRDATMAPTLLPGDVAEILPFRQSGPARGDVVAWRDPSTGRLAVARIAALPGEGGGPAGHYRLTVDNPQAPAPGPVPAAALEGRLTTIVMSTSSQWRAFRGLNLSAWRMDRILSRIE